MDSLLRSLTTDSTLELPTHCVIEQVVYSTVRESTPICKVTAKDVKRTVVTIANNEGTLLVTLRVVRKQFSIRQESICLSPKAKLKFSKEEVLHFVEHVKDTNHIHREEPYVVPGLLLLKHVYRLYGGNSKKHSIHISFKSPTIVGDGIEFIRPDECIENTIHAYAGDILLFTISIES